MSDATLVLAISGIAGIAASIAPSITAFLAYKATKANGIKADNTASVVEKIHTSTNSGLAEMRTDLRAATDKAALLEKQVREYQALVTRMLDTKQ